MSSGRGWYAEKSSKVKAFDAEIARRNQDNEVWADHFYGRDVWSPDLTGREWDRRKYDDIHHGLSSSDKWAIKVCQRYGVTLRVKKYEHKVFNGRMYPVYFSDGKRAVFHSAESALECLVNNDRAVKMWDGESYIEK